MQVSVGGLRPTFVCALISVSASAIAQSETAIATSNSMTIFGNYISGSIDAQIESIPNLPVASGDYTGYELLARIFPFQSGLFLDLGRESRKGDIALTTFLGRLTGSIDVQSHKAGVGYYYASQRSGTADAGIAVSWSGSLQYQTSDVTVTAAALGLNEKQTNDTTRLQFDLTADLLGPLSLGYSGSARIDGSTRDRSNTLFMSMPVTDTLFFAVGYRRSHASSAGFYSAASRETLITLGTTF